MPTPAPMLYIGATPESIRAARDSIQAIIRAAPDREVALAALAAFSKVCESNATITNCNFYGPDSTVTTKR